MIRLPRPRPPAAGRTVLALVWFAGCALQGSIGFAQEPAPGLSIEPAAVALARLDSLMAIVRAEEARVRPALGSEVNWCRLARAWFQVGDHAKAAKCLERARAIGAREFETLLLSGRVARSEGRFAEAVEWLERALRMRPGDWEGHEDLGLALYLDGRVAKAADHWERARALPGSGAPNRGGLTAALRRVGERAYRLAGRGREQLPLVTHAASGAPMVLVTVNGRGPYLFRVDAGVPEVVVSHSLARELGLVLIPGDTTRTPVRFDYATLDSLTLGATSLRGLPVAVNDRAQGGGDPAFRGLLGFEVLRRFRFCIDLPGKLLILEPPGLPGAAADTSAPAWAPASAAAHRVPVLLRGTHLLVAYGRLDHGPERPFLLDLGSPGIALSAPASTIAEAGITLDTTRVRFGDSLDGRVRYVEFPVGHLCVAGACRDSLAGAYGPFPPRLERNPTFRLAGIIAHGFLDRYRFAVDLGRREVWLLEP